MLLFQYKRAKWSGGTIWIECVCEYFSTPRLTGEKRPMRNHGMICLRLISRWDIRLEWRNIGGCWSFLTKYFHYYMLYTWCFCNMDIAIALINHLFSCFTQIVQKLKITQSSGQQHIARVTVRYKLWDEIRVFCLSATFNLSHVCRVYAYVFCLPLHLIMACCCLAQVKVAPATLAHQPKRTNKPRKKMLSKIHLAMK